MICGCSSCNFEVNNFSFLRVVIYCHDAKSLLRRNVLAKAKGYIFFSPHLHISKNMKLYSIVIFLKVPSSISPHPLQLANAMDVNSFGWLQRSGAREVFLFVSREVVQRCQLGARASVSHKV